MAWSQMQKIQNQKQKQEKNNTLNNSCIINVNKKALMFLFYSHQDNNDLFCGINSLYFNPLKCDFQRRRTSVSCCLRIVSFVSS